MNIVRNYQKELDSIIEGLASDIAAGKRSEPPSLLLHSCCAPCSSYVLEYLRPFFKITVFYYNPNISMEPEYLKRVTEQKRLIAAYNETVTTTPGGLSSGNNNEFQAVMPPGLSSVSDNEIQAAIPPGLSGGSNSEIRAVMQDSKAVYAIGIKEGGYEPELFFDEVRGFEDCPEGGERCFKCYEMRLRKTSQVAADEKFDYFATTLSISPLKNAAKLNEIGERLAGECKVRWLPSDFKKKDGFKRSIELSREYGLYRQDYCGCIYSRREREAQAGNRKPL